MITIGLGRLGLVVTPGDMIRIWIHSYSYVLLLVKICFSYCVYVNWIALFFLLILGKKFNIKMVFGLYLGSVLD